MPKGAEHLLALRRNCGGQKKRKFFRCHWFEHLDNWGEVASSKQIFFPPPEISKIIQISQLQLYKDRDFLHQKYVLERLSVKEISGQIFSSRTVVSKYLKRFGIPLRQNDITNKNRSQLRYGEVWRKRQVTLHQREHANIAKMLNLRSQGFSFWKIADILNSMGISNKTGRGRWHARSVQKIIEDNNPLSSA